MSPSPDPLPSWNDGAARRAIVDFVARDNGGGPDFVPPNQRIAVFDNDGTLWSEISVPVQLFFVADRIKPLPPQRPVEEGLSGMNGKRSGAHRPGERRTSGG